ncbi:YciI family protein [Chryseobacterium taklimakanense]|uniref:YciI family protein n=1 Tax=Chryseobacterium taklimakanense TaxID=536441 RepID=UPI0023F7DB59|nr:YciI family protein [Chryseobacterium taklimakanense]
MKTLFTFLLISFALISCAISTKGKDGKPGEPGKSSAEISTNQFDQKLADSLGADKMGMKNYMLVILKTGPNDSKITDKTERAELFKGHFSNMTEMEKSGKLKMAGPLATKNSLGYRGIFLLDVKTEDEARTLLQNDPTIKKGVFDVEILPWYGSAAIPMHLKYHKKISKENP